MNRDDFIKELKEDICKVTFTKVDGTVRVIEGTLKAEHLPEGTKAEEPSDRHVNQDVVPFFDIDDQHWKSFRIDSVISFSTPDHFHYWTNAEEAVDPYLTLPRDVIETQREGKDYSLHIR